MIDPELIKLAKQMTDGATLVDSGGPRDGSQPERPESQLDQSEYDSALQPFTNSGDHSSLHRPREAKSADELAAMILADLKNIGECPQDGVRIVVYGSNPWNAWLSFGVGAGPVYNRAELHSLCDIITERLKRLYDIKA